MREPGQKTGTVPGQTGQTGQRSPTGTGTDGTAAYKAVPVVPLRLCPGIPAENTSAADELAAVREELRTLQAREAELRALMLADPEAQIGKNHRVTIKSVTSRRVNADRLRRDYPDVAAVVTEEITQQQVWVKRHV